MTEYEAQAKQFLADCNATFEHREVISFGFYDNELCVRVR